jgi:hypothetical protein
LIWQPQSIGPQYDLIRQVNGSKFESYSSTIERTKTRTAKFIDYNSILVYDTSCQVIKVSPINPVSLNQGVSGFDPSIIVAAVSEKQDKFFGVRDYLEDSGLYKSAYLYSLNQKGEFVLTVTLNNSLTGSAFGSARFMLNDSYLVVLQLQNNGTNTTNTTNSTDAQISLFSLVDQTFKEDSRIVNVYSVGAQGYFRSCANSSRLFVISQGANGSAILNWYNLENGSLVIKSNRTLDMLVTEITDFDCVGGDSFVVVQSPFDSITLSKYSIDANGTIGKVGAIVVPVQNYYHLAAVMDNLLVISPDKLLTNNTILYYDWNLAPLNLSTSTSQFVYTISIETFSNNQILLLKSDDSLELWTLSNQQLTYSGSFPAKVYSQQ